MKNKRKIGIIGCGNMGEAILKGIIANNVVTYKELYISDVDSSKLDKIKKRFNVDATLNNSIVAKSSDVTIVAVKPQDIQKVLNDISGCLNTKKLLISIVAGYTIEKICSVVGKDIPVVRVMPNMPSLINMGFSALSFSKNVNSNFTNFAKKIFSSIGDVVVIKESQMDAITAISGSGPAYFFYLVELLIDAAIKLGLDKEAAKKSVIKTALGSIELLNRLGESPLELRNKVTSKGGTTEAAFNVFKEFGLDTIIYKAVRAARERAKELSG